MAVPAVSPQPILAPLTPAAIFLVATIGADGEATVHDALSKISGLVRAIGFRDPTKHLSVVVSIGSDAWDRLFAGPRPTELHPFVELTGPRHTAPATPGDLLFHIRAETMDVCFELAGRILKSMGDAVTVVDEVHGFRFFDNRDLLGFVDGTENPSGPSPSRPPRSVTRIEISPARVMCTCRSMCTIWPRGNPSRSPSRSV